MENLTLSLLKTVDKYLVLSFVIIIQSVIESKNGENRVELRKTDFMKLKYCNLR